MKRLPPAKRNMLIVVAVATVVLIALIYFFLIQPQNQKNSKLAADTKAAKAKWEQFKTIIKQSNVTASQLDDISSQLSRAENDIAAGDFYQWTYDTIRRFKANYRLDIPTIGTPVISDVDLLPNLPYKQIKITLNGAGYFHEIGKFFSDFENNFPHMRLVNLQFEQTAGPGGTPSERLSFRTDVVVLVKSNP